MKTNTKLSWSKKLYGLLIGIGTLLIPHFTTGQHHDHYLTFDGVDDYIALQMDYSGVDAINQITIEAWVRTTVAGENWNANWAIIDFDRSDFFNVYIRGDDGKVGFSTFSGKIDDFQGNKAINDGQWHHIAAVYNGQDKLIYVDGILDAIKKNPHGGAGLGNKSTRYGFIGDGSEATAFNDQRNNLYYLGDISEIRIWNYARTSGELVDKKGINAIKGTESNLLACFTFDNGEVIDITGKTSGHLAFNSPKFKDDGPLIEVDDPITNPQSPWTSTSESIYFNDGKVGIGISSPMAVLDIYGDGSSSDLLNLNNNGETKLKLTSSSANPQEMPALVGRRSRGTLEAPVGVMSNDNIFGLVASPYIDGAFRNAASIVMKAGDVLDDTHYSTYITFNTTNETTLTERMRITEDGKVGIGKSNPDFMLDVAGSINATDILINGQSISKITKGSVWSEGSGNVYYLNRVGIGTTNPDPNAMLTVGGMIHARSVEVSIDAGADFVFDPNYSLMNLLQLETFLNRNKHLPGIASAASMQSKGLDLGEFAIQLLQKVEELTLYTIEQHKEIESRSQKIAELHDMMKRLEALEAVTIGRD